MGITDIFSRRQKASSDVLSYDEIPHELRIQLLHAMDDADSRIYDQTIPEYHVLGREGKDCFAVACQVLRRELGLGRLIEIPRKVRYANETETEVFRKEFTTFFENCETEHVLDAIEIVMRLIENAEYYLDDECNAQTVAAEINGRFRQHAIGYQYQSGQIIKESNQLLHSTVIVPALSLLSDNAYAGPNDECLKALEHYRHGRSAECLVDCLKAFESTMKVICGRKRWPVKDSDTAKVLIKTCLDKGLIPTFSEQQLTSLRTLLESGIPTARNKRAGHGQGAQRVEVPDRLARYVLNITASTILLLIESAEQ